MDGLTHVAAILLGVILTLFVAKSFQKSSDASVITTTNAAAPQTVSRSTLRKRKKKKVKVAAINSDGLTEPELGEETPKTKELGQQQNKPEENAENTVTKKKKKKKKSSSAKALSETINEEKKLESTGKETVASRAAMSSQKSLVQQEQPIYNERPKPKQKKNIVVEKEEAWGIVAGPKKRKPKQKKPMQITSALSVPAASESITVDVKKIGIIIGPKGSTMMALEEKTGCKLDINAPSRDDSQSKTSQPQKAGIILSGDKEGMAMAKKAILELASKGYATILQDENFGEFGAMIHPRYLSEIVGPGGKTIQALQSALDVKLTIPSTDWKPNAPQTGQVKLCKVGIAGSKENSKQAKVVIQSLIKYHHHEITHPGLIHEIVHIPQEFFHCVIGQRGNEIRHIRGNFKVEIFMPNADSYTEDITIVGKQTNVDRAISYIHTLMDRDAEQRELKYNDESY
mmetsp:Transcript_14759/g.16911  ORF Transcript_14759/g.16911 Transcript_14759/m.16911 type:complete len:458 (-) Transcript_14759:253-1626(-)|eukprot:CAMPEP_0194144982 /NCGR_PEP_ID=MMETSP0152-20130528/13922_1 /TAXON_ID=1049557 /ORGANISM="Thalassiothrix antarctica, Strain L6-D1" /LENGTH=457 /DNA_ID=CAMNT_0038845009 /DNA_START=167 /DNA_END=1540 /DNA_ORIENTATION=-